MPIYVGDRTPSGIYIGSNLITSIMLDDVNSVGWQDILPSEEIVINELSYDQHRSDTALYAIKKRDATYQFEIRQGDRETFDDSTKDRSELTSTIRYDKGVPIWNSHAFMISSGFIPESTAGKWFIIGQWHGDDDLLGRSPHVALNMSGNTFQVIARAWNGTSISTLNLDPSASISNFPRNTYHNIVMENLVDETNGYLRVWLNGTQIVDYSGQFGYWDEDLAGYWKFGIYRSTHNQIGFVEYQNNEEGTTSLSDRITSPLPLDRNI